MGVTDRRQNRAAVLKGPPAAPPADWAPLVTVLDLCAPWWPTAHVVCVVQLRIDGVASRLTAHVVRARGGECFISYPSTRAPDGTWRAQFEPTPDLADAIGECVLVAFVDWSLDGALWDGEE